MRPLAVYVHIPFCTVKCGYCDFNAYAGMDALKPSYREALLAEVASYATLLAGRELTSIHFGGGTPGEQPAADIAAVIAQLRCLATLAKGAEVGLEANPGTTSYEDLAQLHAAGVNRLSLGAQSFDPAELRFLDRIHSPEATVATVRNARAAGFDSVSLDLIYGLPGQSEESWEQSLRAALELGPEHISCYALTVEEGTLLGRCIAHGTVPAPDADLQADMYDLATGVLASAGFRQYELSNWARPGHESRHNQVYWTDGDYLGIGAGAHGYLDGRRYENIAHPRSYIAALARQDDRSAVAHSYDLDRATAMSDWLALRLRLLRGFARGEFATKFGTFLDEAVGPVIDECRDAGLLEASGDSVRLTRRGRQLHGEVAVRLLLHLQRGVPAR